jgi:hypothetical protein
MNRNFLVTPTTLNQAFESDGKASGFSNGITRRSFLKRTGAASVATLVAWNMTSQQGKGELNLDLSGDLLIASGCPPHLPRTIKRQVLRNATPNQDGLMRVWYVCDREGCGAQWTEDVVLKSAVGS